LNKLFVDYWMQIITIWQGLFYFLVQDNA